MAGTVTEKVLPPPGVSGTVASVEPVKDQRLFCVGDARSVVDNGYGDAGGSILLMPSVRP